MRLRSRGRWFDRKGHLRRNIIRIGIEVFAWIGLAILYYIGFSIFFDTPLEYQTKRSTRNLKREYVALNDRLDSLNVVLDNLSERDRNLFKILFEAEPYSFDTDSERTEEHQKLLDESNRSLGDEFFKRMNNYEKKLKELHRTNNRIVELLKTKGQAVNFIPSIQPIINKDLTLLTTSYGQRIQPFYKTLASHQGVDFALPEGSRIFATADGVVRDVNTKTSSGGIMVIIDHKNGYKTEYRHLSKSLVASGKEVKRGDIIALSGNTGLSLAPHLHYEVSHNGMRVDPIHYFFMELSPSDYHRITAIARSGMQSFD